MPNCVVFMKQVIDPELRLSSFRLDSSQRQVRVTDASLVASPYDENALEVALQLVASRGGKVAVVCLSNSAEAEKMLRRALAVNAAEAVLVMSQEYGETFNSFQSAYVLCKALAALSFQPDLILAGRQAADTDAGHVGPLVAELLGWPCVTLVGRLEMRDGRLVAQGVEGDYEYVWEVELPAVVTVTSAPGNQLRYPKVKDLIAAQKRPVTRVDDLISIGVSREELMRWGDRMQVSRLELAGGTRKCEVIRGADPDAMANAAVDWLRKKGIV